ncbi:hypothetical protein HMPREF3039_01011 [Akkermansia sp. KLE1798]|nr:hypothetical protein HMPREF3039_01011 [Akkermansia sp. KLE1798]
MKKPSRGNSKELPPGMGNTPRSPCLPLVAKKPTFRRKKAEPP